MEQRLELNSLSRVETMVIHYENRSVKNVQHLIKVIRNPNDDSEICDKECFFYIPGKYLNCVRKSHYVCEPLVECNLSVERFERVDIYHLFEKVIKGLESKGIKVYSNYSDISRDLSNDIKSLYIQVLNPKLTKETLEIIKGPSRFGYKVFLTVKNDELTIEYKYGNDKCN